MADETTRQHLGPEDIAEMDVNALRAAAQPEPLRMTRAAAVAMVRASERRCRGRAGSRLFRADHAATERDAIEKAVRAKITALLAQGDEVAARAVDNDLRAGCGRDFNDTVLAGPLDGQEHAYECPGCGAKGTYRAPLIAIES